jgi:hypothetical protein
VRVPERDSAPGYLVAREREAEIVREGWWKGLGECTKGREILRFTLPIIHGVVFH